MIKNKDGFFEPTVSELFQAFLQDTDFHEEQKAKKFFYKKITDSKKHSEEEIFEEAYEKTKEKFGKEKATKAKELYIREGTFCGVI